MAGWTTGNMIDITKNLHFTEAKLTGVLVHPGPGQDGQVVEIPLPDEAKLQLSDIGERADTAWRDIGLFIDTLVSDMYAEGVDLVKEQLYRVVAAGVGMKSGRVKNYHWVFASVPREFLLREDFDGLRYSHWRELIGPAKLISENENRDYQDVLEGLAKAWVARRDSTGEVGSPDELEVVIATEVLPPEPSEDGSSDEEADAEDEWVTRLNKQLERSIKGLTGLIKAVPDDEPGFKAEVAGWVKRLEQYSDNFGPMNDTEDNPSQLALNIGDPVGMHVSL